MGLLIFYAVISIFFSFLCSILEAVLLSITPTFINVKKQEGKAYATELENLKKDAAGPEQVVKIGMKNNQNLGLC